MPTLVETEHGEWYSQDETEMTNFDQESATKLWTPRPQNVRYTPIVGGTWLFFDADNEKDLVEWLVEEISEDGKSVTIQKLTGKDSGYKTVYDMDKLKARRWKPKTDKDAVMVFAWPCPSCQQDKGVPVGDYLCGDCRSTT